MISRMLYRFLQLEFKKNPSDQLGLFLHIIPYRMDKSIPLSQQRLITLCHLLWKLRKCNTEAKFSTETWQLINTTPPSKSSLNPFEDLLFLVFPKIALATVNSIQVKINYINVLPESGLSWQKRKRKKYCLILIYSAAVSFKLYLCLLGVIHWPLKWSPLATIWVSSRSCLDSKTNQ